ncbi:CopG family transcriptional regulator|uniref:Putative iron-only hydrogenase system regulator n=1 Tax=Dendrosporobacter quercicolus TaxID=146817 RepID=A0A1G9RXP4_9FIRM|nr:TM1266 family iron-only hydrogenase system putative regulator [Dendrosporobacter quercicolus]NSL49313.1 CopG family transcriptional regulator [Dendrosporobacter quercicolus DSM 1736]SDM27780.1 putative iron-only hydrogenase system regulator [Dendrosporobacter quercicolus]
MSKRIGVVGIIIDNPKQNSGNVNRIISSYSQLVIGRMGIPKPEEQVGMIALIIEGSTDQVGALTGKLGNLPGVTVKSALTSKNLNRGNQTNDEQR